LRAGVGNWWGFPFLSPSLPLFLLLRGWAHRHASEPKQMMPVARWAHKLAFAHRGRFGAC